MRHVAEITSAARIGINKERVTRGLAPIARDHLPFNRRSAPIDRSGIEHVARAATEAGLIGHQVVELRDQLWRISRRPEGGPKEEFMLSFNAALDAAREIVWNQIEESPRAALDVYTVICHAVARNSIDAEISRREVARKVRLSEHEVSKITSALARTEPPLLLKEQDGRGVRYTVLPVGEDGFPLWFGDRGARIDAKAEATKRLLAQDEAERAPELAL